MGTSASHPGSGNGSPLVPPGTDPANPDPGPPPDPDRFRKFRLALGSFVKSGDGGDLRRAVRSFASTTLGGADTGSRRYGSVAQTGAQFISALQARGGMAAALQDRGIDVRALRGAPLDAVVSAIAGALAPEGIDKERIEEAIREALFEVLEDVEEVDIDQFGGLDESQLLVVAVRYLETAVFLHIQQEGGASMDKASSPTELVQRENQLRDLVHIAVNQFASARHGGKITTLSKANLDAAQRAIVADVLRYWEGGDD